MRRSLKDLRGVEKDSYKGLPEELREFNYYIPDCGNVIMAVPECLLEKAEENGELDMFECPFPVKYVLEKGYRIYKNHVICEGKDDKFVGLQVEEDYYEYNRPSKSSGGSIYTNALINALKGKVFPSYIGMSEGTLFDMSDTGATLTMFMYDPEKDEIAQFDRSKPVEIRFAAIKDVIMMTIKLGNLEWWEAPYSVHLSRNLTRMPVIEDGKGINLTLMLVNIRTGRVENVKVVQLSTEFSVALCKAIDKQRSTKFSNTMYNINIDRLYDMYTADQLAEMGTTRCKIG